VRIRIVYYGQAQQITGREEEQFETAAESSLGDVMAQLIERHGDGLAQLLLTDKKRYRGSVILAVNNETADPEAYGSLKDNDEIAILPAISGG
jgi:MoaD family protein